MDVNDLDNELKLIADKKNRLSELSYSDSEYDELEEELHNLEDEILEKYGTYLEDAFNEVHDEYCPDTEVLSPIAYIANKYKTNGGGYDVDPGEGVPVDVDDYPGKSSRLVLIPGPPRIVLQVADEEKMEVWKAN